LGDFGISVAGAGDIDADGYSDIIVGAPHYINNSADTGRVYVFFGSPSGLQNSGKQVLTCDNYTAHFGNAVSSAGDVNGDGFSDILVGAEEYSNGESKEGKAFLFYGSANIFPAQITNIFPLQNAINVNKSSDITVEFGQEMNASTINSSNIKVFGFETGLLSTSISYNPGSKTATINPNINFKTGEKIQVTLTSGIQSATNISINPFTWSFTVQALSGTGVFTEARIVDSTGSSSGDQITSGDFNGDGKPDLAQINQNPEVFIYFNDGNANFSVSQIIYKNYNASGGSIACGDFDSDGDMDLFISFVGVNDSIFIYKNNGSGFFTQSFAANYNSGYRRPPVVNDFDADGDLDIISLTSDSWDINLFINDGSGNLTHSYILPDLDYTNGNFIRRY
jgi:hypothetical protein